MQMSGWFVHTIISHICVCAFVQYNIHILSVTSSEQLAWGARRLCKRKAISTLFHTLGCRNSSHGLLFLPYRTTCVPFIPTAARVLVDISFLPDESLLAIYEATTRSIIPLGFENWLPG